MKGTLLITGYKGFIGTNIVKLLKKKFKIIKLKKVKNFKFMKNNHSYYEKIEVEKNNINTLIHCSYYTPNSFFSDNEQFRLNNVVTKNISYLIKKYEIRNCIFLSSMAVYDTSNSKIVNEKKFTKNKTVYARSKLRDEKNFYKLFKDGYLDLVSILRLPGVVGKNSKNNFISKLAENIKKNKKLELSNPNFKFNNIIHIKTLIKFIELILKFKKKNYYIFNLGSEKPIKIKKILDLMINNLNKNYKELISYRKGNKPFQINFNYAKKNGYKANLVENEIKNYIKDL